MYIKKIKDKINKEIYYLVYPNTEMPSDNYCHIVFTEEQMEDLVKYYKLIKDLTELDK